MKKHFNFFFYLFFGLVFASLILNLKTAFVDHNEDRFWIAFWQTATLVWAWLANESIKHWEITLDICKDLLNDLKKYGQS